MSRWALVLTSYLLAVGLGAALLGFGAAQRIEGLQAEIQRLEADVERARREASDWERVAVKERDRAGDLREEVVRVRRALDTGAPPADGSGGSDEQDDTTGMGDTGNGGDARIEPPETWDGRRLRLEMQRLALRGRRIGASPLLGACVEAARAHGDAGVQLMVDVLRTEGLSENLKTVATLILEKLEDPRGTKPLLERWSAISEFPARRVTLRALANIPGAEQVPTLLDIWGNAQEDPRIRLLAIHALAMRRHPTAVAVVAGGAESTPPLRARAIESLHFAARAEGYEHTALVDAFSKALLSAAGEPQQRLTLLALEGFWSVEGVAALRGYAQREDVAQGLRDRATKAADAIERGDPQPDGAGLTPAQRRQRGGGAREE